MNRILTGLIIYLLAIGQAWPQATLLPNAKQVFLGTTGAPLASGTVTMYVPNSTNLKTTWEDPAQSINNTNPVVLDAAGRSIIFGQGNYRQVVKDKNGVLIWDSFTSAPGSASPSGATGTDTAPVGTIMPFSGFAIPTNWQLAYGQAVSRTGFPDLFTALTIVDKTASCTSTSTTISGLASTAMMHVGAPIEATCIPTNTTIATIASSTSITVSQAAVSSATVTTTVFPWGNGDGVSTFNVPDLRGRTFAGADAMGGSAASRLTATYYGAGASAPGVAGGLQSQTIAQTNLPNVNFYAGATINTNQNAIWQSSGPASQNLTTGGSSFFQVGTGSTTAGFASVTIPAVPSGGSGTAFSVIQPTITVNYIIKMVPNTTGAGGVVSLGGMFGDIVCASSLTCAPISTVNTIGCTISTTVQLGCVIPDGTTVTVDGSGKISAIAGIASQINIGVTTVSGGTNPYLLYNNAGVLGNLPVTGTSGNVVLSIAPTITGHPTIEGVTSTGSTGTGNLVFSTVPSFTDPVLGAATGTTLALGGCTLGSTVLCATGHLLIEGVTSTGATGTGNFVFATSPSVTGLTVTGSFTATGLIANASLINPSTTVNGQTCTLGSTCTITAVASSLIVGTTAITSGTTTRVLFDNAGTLGEYSISGSSSVCMTTSCVMVTPTLGAAIGTSLALGGATLGANALAITGHLLLEGVTSTGATGTGKLVFDTAPTFSSTVNAVTGYQVNGAATTAHYLRGNGTNYVDSAILAGDLPIVGNASGSPSATFGVIKCDGTTITCAAGVATASGGSATAVTVGTTTVGSGTTAFLLYNNAGVLGNESITTALGNRTTLPTTSVCSANASSACTGGFNGSTTTYTTPANVLWIEIQLSGGGGGGGAGGSGGNNGANGTATTFNGTTYSAGGGTAGLGATAAGGAGGAVSGGYLNIVGQAGGNGGVSGSTAAPGGYGGSSCLPGGGGIGTGGAGAGAGTAGTGGGGGGGTATIATQVSGGGGGGGGCVKAIINSPSATYSYVVGPGGSGGTIGTGSQAGASGAVGNITIIEHYGS